MGRRRQKTARTAAAWATSESAVTILKLRMSRVSAVLHLTYRPQSPVRGSPIRVIRRVPRYATRLRAAATTLAADGRAQSSSGPLNGIGRSGIDTRLALIGPASSTASAMTSDA
jgi:hypothetical protein